jgi:hypothetical protein
MKRPRGETKRRDRRRDGGKVTEERDGRPKYRGERELERKIVEIHRGRKKEEKRKWTAEKGIGVLTEGKRHRERDREER